MDIIKSIVAWANANGGFLTLIEIILTAGIFGAVWKFIRPKPSFLFGKITGMAFPQRMDFEFEQTTEKPIIFHEFQVTLNTRESFRIEEPLPIIIRGEKKEIRATSNLNGMTEKHKEVIIKISFGFIGQKRYQKEVKIEITPSGPDMNRKIILP